jgi:hypothetical protein
MSNESLQGAQLFLFAARANRAAFHEQAKKLARLERIKQRAMRLKALRGVN